MLAFAQDSTDSAPPPASARLNQVSIPGPLRSFLRMAGLSQKLTPEEVLPELARNVYTEGYVPAGETEFLFLLQKYVRQARDLQRLATPPGEIRVARCEDAGPLLQVLGYKMQGACGQKDTALVTLNPDNAFLTIDSGFPLTRLEEALQTGKPFVYPYAPSSVPVLLRSSDWANISTWKGARSQDLVDVLLYDPHVARLYWAMSRMDPDTRTSLERSAGLGNLLPYASVLDYYGAQICIRSKRVVVPGGPAAESGWRDLVGASPASPGEFVMHLVEQDRGWLAAYYDALARVDQAQQAHLTHGSRLHGLYDALREQGFTTNAAGAAFRKGSDLLILFTRQQWTPDGQPRLPGNLDLWKQVLGKHGRHVNHPEQVLEAMVSASRTETNRGPLQIYLSLAAVEDAPNRKAEISPATLLLMADDYAEFSSWYPIFSEFAELNDDSISHFLRVAESTNKISDLELRGNALGILQANLGLWQILSRQGEIPKGQLASSWQKVIDPFGKVASAGQLFDAGEASLGQLMLASTGSANISQSDLIDRLAGPPQESAEGRKIRATLSRRMQTVLDDQRLTSLDTLAELGEGLSGMAHGGASNERLLALAGDLREFEMPRPIFTEQEKLDWAPGLTNPRHTEIQVKTDLAKLIQQPNSPQKIQAARGLLAPFLRDTLVGLNYAYYEPPGSQILHINPLFVRAHDFSGETVVGTKYVWQPATLFGQGASAGGGAYLVGSLADLPYVLAATEQNLIAPENVQALIWQEITPSILAGATLSRWWNVSPHELHAVALYQRSGEELLTAAATNPRLRDKVVAILADRLSPQQLQRVEAARQPREMTAVISRLAPADTFFLAAEFRRLFPQESASLSASSEALDQLARQYAGEVTMERISRDFGVPHPTLAQTYGRELINVRTFPAFAGYSYRLFGESWDSGNLYWARFADERGESPEALNVLAPELTRVMISKIFASDVEDSPSLVRAMRETGDDLQHGTVALLPQTGTTAPE
jgi:hypothetical protein